MATMHQRRLIAVCGATGNQGGSVTRLLLQHPSAYAVRAITRKPSSLSAKALANLGAEIFQADLTVPDTLRAALEGCWGVFGVTNFYDAKITNDPSSEEQQGRNLANAALDAGVQCFVWSTLPSSKTISSGRFVSRIYEGKHQVDSHIRTLGLPAAFLYTGNFYENMILRGHVVYHAESDELEFRQPVIRGDTKLAMLDVEKDLSAITKAVFDQWDTKKEQLNHQYLYCSNARVSPAEIVDSIQKVTGKNCVYTVLSSTGVPDRDIMFQLYNEMGMYGSREIPDPNVLALGVELHDVEDFVRTRLIPHLGL